MIHDDPYRVAAAAGLRFRLAAPGLLLLMSHYVATRGEMFFTKKGRRESRLEQKERKKRAPYPSIIVLCLGCWTRWRISASGEGELPPGPPSIIVHRYTTTTPSAFWYTRDDIELHCGDIFIYIYWRCAIRRSYSSLGVTQLFHPDEEAKMTDDSLFYFFFFPRDFGVHTDGAIHLAPRFSLRARWSMTANWPSPFLLLLLSSASARLLAYYYSQSIHYGRAMRTMIQADVSTRWMAHRKQLIWSAAPAGGSTCCCLCNNCEMERWRLLWRPERQKDERRDLIYELCRPVRFVRAGIVVLWKWPQRERIENDGTIKVVEWARGETKWRWCPLSLSPSFCLQQTIVYIATTTTTSLLLRLI